MSLEFSFQFINQHRGPYEEFLRRYETAAADAQSAGSEAFAQFCGDLPTYLADERNLMSAVDHLFRFGGTAPGPDGQKLVDLCRMERWTLVRELRDRLRSGRYERGPLRRCRIWKRIGSSAKRTIWVANLADRVVARGAAQILVPLLEQAIDPLSFCWPGRGRLTALAHAAEQVAIEGRPMCITEDLRDAFDQVPRERLAQVLRHYIPCAEFCAIVMHLAARQSRRGILQGSPLSQALLDLYLSHMLHRRWNRGDGRPPLGRYVDDTLINCTPTDDTAAVHRELERCIRAAGMRPKVGIENAIADLREHSATWLGYRLRVINDRLLIRSAFFAPTTHDRRQQKHEILVGKFARLHERPVGWRNANSLVRGIVADLAPTLPFEDPLRVYHLIASAAADAGFREITSFEVVLEQWRAAHGRWLLRLRIPMTP